MQNNVKQSAFLINEEIRRAVFDLMAAGRFDVPYNNIRNIENILMNLPEVIEYKLKGPEAKPVPAPKPIKSRNKLKAERKSAKK